MTRDPETRFHLCCHQTTRNGRGERKEDEYEGEEKEGAEEGDGGEEMRGTGGIELCPLDEIFDDYDDFNSAALYYGVPSGSL